MHVAFFIISILPAPVALFACVFCCVCGLSGYVNILSPSIGTFKHYFAIFKNYFFVPVHGMENRREQKTLFFSLILKEHDQTGKLKQVKNRRFDQ